MLTRGWQRLLPGFLAAVFAVGCTDSTTGDSSTGGSGGNNQCANNARTCRVAQTCGGGFECRVPDAGGDGCCVKVICTADSDCTAPAKCNIQRGICAVDACDPAVPSSCPAGTQCVNTSNAAGEVLSECVPVGNVPTPATCTFDVAQFSLRQGETRKLNLTGYSAAGAQLPRSNAALTSSAMAVATVGTDGTVTAVGAGEATISGAATTPCTATLKVYGTVPAADARAVVFDGRTGAPLAGVKVQLRKNTGTPVVVDTNASGEATFTGGGPAADIKDITAFPAGHTWVTYVAPGTNDVAFYTDPALPAGQVAGVNGTFNLDSAAPPVGDIKLGLAAFSIAGALSDLNLAGLIGKTVPTDVVIPSASINQMDVPLPSGVYLKFSSENIKTDVDMYVDGPCTSAAPCKRVLWGLGGQVSLGKIGPIISGVAGGGGDINAASILTSVLPFFKKFYHFAQGKFELTQIADPGENVRPTFPGTPVTVRPNFLLAKGAQWVIPTLPTLPWDNTKNVSGALVLTGSLVAGQGFVPLGISAGLDECTNGSTSTCKTSAAADGLISCADENGTSADECMGYAAGDVVLDYAPPHDGLEGSPFATVAVALDINNLTSGTALTSVLVSLNSTITPQGSGKNNFAGDFLGFNKGGYTAATRTYTGTSRVTGADFYRLNLDTNGATWLVYFKPAADAFSVEVPPVAAGVTGDRTTELDMQAFRLFTGAGQPASLTALEEFNSTNFDGLVNYTGAFSTQECTPIYPARDCTSNEQCAAGGWDDTYTCDTTAGVCVSADNGVSAKPAAGACPAGTREGMTTAMKAVCSRIPACELQ